MAKTRSKKQDPSGPHENAPSSGALGDKLRQRREEKGLALQHVSDRTKLRPAIIEAIEGERWEELPAPPFVRGFLRTYAKLLELDEEEVLELYEARVPTETRPFEPILTRKGPRKIGWVFALLVILAIVGATYWWIQQPPPGISRRKATPPTQKKEVKHETKKNLEKKKDARLDEEIPENKGVSPPAQAAQATEQSLAQIPPTASTRENSTLGENQPEENTQEVAPPQPAPALVLRGVVKERTWMRVATDDGQPKEYIFDPGSRPVWNAQRVFDIMIGNAAGIELELNGKPLGSLGKRGKVIHLVLPKQS